MKQNPEVVLYQQGTFAIRFTRKSWVVLIWIQDLFSRKLKLSSVNRPIVEFSSREEAEKEVRDVVIPYLLKEKVSDSEEIIGW